MEETESPQPPEAPAGRSLFKKILIGASVLAAFAVLALGSFVVYAVKRKKPKTKLPPELADYKPAPLSDPAYLPMHLPSGLEDADAGEEYARMIGRRLALLQTPDGFARLKADKTLSAEDLADLDAALKKKRCAIIGVGLAPDDLNERLLYTAAVTSVIMSAKDHLRAPAEAARERKDWPAAIEHNRRLALFGWHMAQDWESATQMLGITVVVGGLLGQGAAWKSLPGNEGKPNFDAARASLDMIAYAPDKDALKSLAADAGDPARLAASAARLADPRGRRAYADWLLLMSAIRLTPAEIAAARASPERAAFFESLSRDPDPRLSALATAYARVLGEVEREFRAAGPAGAEATRRKHESLFESFGRAGR